MSYYSKITGDKKSSSNTSIYKNITGEEYKKPNYNESFMTTDIKKKKKNEDWIKKSEGNFFETIGGTIGDLATDIGKGFMTSTEGVADFLQYRTSDVLNFFGAEDAANAVKENAKFNSTGALFGENEDVNDNLFKKGWTDNIENNSILGDNIDQINQGIGNIAAMAGMTALGGAALGGGATALGAGEKGLKAAQLAASAFTSYSSAYGNARSEAYKNGADDSTANKTGMVNGFAEAISEQFFNGIPGMKSAGWADKLTGKAAGKIAKVFNTNTGKLFMKLADAAGEGAEEMISNALTATGNDIVHLFDKNYTYGMEEQSGNIIEDFGKAFFSEDSLKSCLSAALTSAIVGGGNTFVTQTQKNNMLKAYAKDNNISFKDAKAKFDTTVESETNTIGGKNISFNDKMELQNDIQKQELKNMKRGIYVEQGQRDKAFQYKETGNEKVDAMLKNLSERSNNTTEAHAIANMAEKFMNDLGVDVEFINNEEISKMDNTDLKKMLDEGITVNGFKKGNSLVLNLDSKELASFVMGHETSHFLESDKELYKDVKDCILEAMSNSKSKDGTSLLDINTKNAKNLYAEDIKSKIAEEEKKLGRSLNEEERASIEQNVIETEMVADQIGYFMNDTSFYDSLSKKPNGIQKFFNFLQQMYYKVTGREQKAQILKAQQKIRELYADYIPGSSKGNSSELTRKSENEVENINLPSVQETTLKQAENEVKQEINLPIANNIVKNKNNSVQNVEKTTERTEKPKERTEKPKVNKVEEAANAVIKQNEEFTKKYAEETKAKLEKAKIERESNLPTKTKVDNIKGVEKIKSKYDSSSKIPGSKSSIVLASGEKLNGAYKLVESGSVTSSHNAENFTKSEGFPTTENGTTINDRDYENDKNAQRLVNQKSANYDGRAFADNGVVVTKDGIVVSGNDRTMAGDLAAKNNTDAAYLDYLKENASKYGFTQEQIESMKHPRIVFELDDDVDYNTKTFAKFNKDSKKTKSISEKAKEIGKTIDNDTIDAIASIINDDRFDTIDDLYNNEKATKDLIGILQAKGIVDTNDFSEIYNGSKFTGSGKDLVESVILGSVISEDNAKYFSNNNDLKFKVMKSAPAIIKNKTLGEYSINDVVNNAIDVFKKASTSKLTIDEFTNQYNIFGDNDVDLVTKRIAQLLETKGYKNLRNFMEKYNAMAELPASGQTDIFSGGEVETKDDVLKKALNIDDNAEIQYSLGGINSNLSLSKEKKLKIAEYLKGKKVKDKFIWALTGWNLDRADGKWKYELNDAKIKEDVKLIPETDYILSDVVDADELFKAYPELKDYEFNLIDMIKAGYKESVKGLVGDSTNGGYGIYLNKNNSKEQNNSTLIHEIQHVIQIIEGFAQGGSQEYYIDGGRILNQNIDDDFAYDLYKRTAGEVESRNVQGRAKLSPLEKRLNNFNETRDTDIQKIVKREEMQRYIDKAEAKKASNGIQYSLSNKDNQGRELTKEQQEYFKDSKVVDNDGNLLTMYHGTKADFNSFIPSKGGEFGPGVYLADNEDTAKWYSKYVSKGENESKVMPVYVDMKNPYYIDKLDYIDKTANVTPKTFMNRLIKKGYDGIIGTESNGYSKQYVAFEPNQIKDVNNEKPTDNPDIHYSLSGKDNTGRSLTEEQRNYFKDSKVVDANGNLITVYHGTGETFTKFEKEMIGSNFDQDIQGFFFTDDVKQAEDYANTTSYGMPRQKPGNVMETYLNITNPLVINIDYDPISYWDENYESYLEKANKNGNDGIIIKAQKYQNMYVAFEPNQIKNVDNTNPTTNEDIRYSLSAKEESVNDAVYDISVLINKNENGNTSDKVDNDYIDELIFNSKYYKEHYIDEDNSDLDDDVIYEKNQDLYDEMYSDILYKLTKEGISSRYESGEDTYYYDRQELAQKGYDELVNYLNKNNYDYQISKSTEAGALPSIYVQDKDGNKFRIANHWNHQSTDLEKTNDNIYSNKDYANWKENIIKDMNNALNQEALNQTSDDIRYSLSDKDLKNKQNEIIQQTNPMEDDYHTGIRSANDIRTWEEVLQLDDDTEGQFAWGDYTRKDAEEALNNNKITIYSSYPIKDGVFVSTSYVQAQEYAGGRGSKVYSKEVPLNNVAWINGDEGQYAKVNNTGERYSLSNEGNNGEALYEPKNKFNARLSDTKLEQPNLPVPGDNNTENLPSNDEEDYKVRFNKTVMLMETKKKTLIDESNNLKEDLTTALNSIDDKINAKQNEYDSKKSKDTMVAQSIKRQIETLKTRRSNIELMYANRIDALDEKIKNFDAKVEAQKITRNEAAAENRNLAREQIGDIFQIKDKKKGIQYQLNTMKRNLRDIMKPGQAKKMYDTYFKTITENNAKIETEITSYNERIKKFGLSDEESTYTQMIGEKKYNPKSNLTNLEIENYYAKNSNKIDKTKCEKAANEFRNIYDELIGKINNELTANGYKPIEYRKGYFPHFIEEKATSPIGKLAEKMGWKVKQGTLPTDIAGITEQFKPGKAWTSFSQQRNGDATDYNALKGLDNYLRGAMDVIYHTKDIQKLRALENEIRYQYSEQGIKDKIDSIYQDEMLDIEEKNDAIAQLTSNYKNNSLGNFATELRNYTDSLANKKSFSDRSMEHSFGRDTYSIMQNVNQRVSANMVGANISSALTNFIPITQAWSQVSTSNLMKGIQESIRTSIKDDGFTEKSTFLTNRTRQAERLYQTGLEKINNKLGIPFEAIDSFTSNAIVRAKYYENLDKGMSEQEAISNADEFAKDVMAGRSKGDSPTIMNQKNPIAKLFTAFQLEVNNQYGYMFKDIPADLGGEGKDKLATAFIKMFFGAWLYNWLSEKITGRKSAFSPIDMAIDDIKTATNENMDLGEKINAIATDTAQELPFVGGIMGGGRLPIQGAIPYSNPLDMVTSTISDAGKAFDEDEDTKKTAINNLVKEWSKPLYYVAAPFAGGQIKKTVEGMSMYNENLPISGSYTNSGKLRFEADDSILGKAQSAIFGQYASKNAREYFENGYSPLTEKQVNTAMDADLGVNEFREYDSGVKSAKKTAKENGTSQTEATFNYITNLPLEDSQKNSLLNNYLDKEESGLNYSDYGSLEEFNYSNSNPEKYSAIMQITDFNSYNNYKDYIEDISDEYQEEMDNALTTAQKTAITNKKKKAIFNYVNGLDLNKYQKTMLYRLAGGYSIKNYKNDMFNYINSLDLTKEEKETIYGELFS